LSPKVATATIETHQPSQKAKALQYLGVETPLVMADVVLRGRIRGLAVSANQNVVDQLFVWRIG